MNTIKIIQYKWAGSWGPFSIKVACGECGLTEGIIQDVIATEFPDADIIFETKDWLPNWWRILLRGGWHAPITTLNGKIIAQGAVIDRGLLSARIREILDYSHEPEGNVVFYKEGCRHCKRAKALLDTKGVVYTTHNVVTDPHAAQWMFAAAKRHIGDTTPVTVPQIWIDGDYIGGADDLEAHYANQ